MQLSISQTAVLLAISIGTLRRWDREDYLKPSFRTMGGHRRYDLHYLEERFFGKNLPWKWAQARLLCRHNKKSGEKAYYLQVSFPVPAPAINTHLDRGAIGVDLNVKLRLPCLSPKACYLRGESSNPPENHLIAA